MFLYGKSSNFQKSQKGLFTPIYQLFINKFNPKGSSGGKMGDWGLFFRSPIYILYYYTFVYTYKNNPPFPQKSPKALKTLTFLWGIFLKMPRKKPPKSPHRGQKSPTGQKNTPQGWLNLTGRGWSSFRPIFYYGGYICAFNQGGLKSDWRCSVREL